MKVGGLLRELAGRRDLAWVLTWREVVVRYKRSLLGVAWALAEPLAMVAVYAFVFGRVLKAAESVDTYPLFAMLGVIAWTFFTSTLEQSSACLIEHAPLIRKVYFPRELLIFAVAFGRLTTLLISLVLAAVFVVIARVAGYSVTVGPVLWLVPGVLALGLLAIGLSLALSALNVLFRDVGFIVRFLLRLGFFACPIAYPVSLVPVELRSLYELNPLVAVLWMFQRAAAVTMEPPGPVGIATAVVAVVVVPPLGWYVFRRLRGTVSDLI